MKAKYQKYYDALKGANIGAGQSNLSSAFSSSKSSMSGVQSALSSSSYTELAAMTINNITIPQISQAMDDAASSASSAIGEVISAVESLVGMLEALDSLEKELESLGSKWTYTEGGSKSKSEVNSHYNKIDELTKKVEEQESSIDGQIAAINGISVAAIDIASISVPTASADDTNAKDETEEKKETEEKTPSTTKFEDAVSVSADGKLYWDGKSKYSIPTDATIAAKKAEFLGKWDDPSQYSYYNGNNLFGERNELVMFDNTTGEIIPDGKSITIKPGETRVLTVKLPTNAGPITQITRTTSDGNGAYNSKKIITGRSDLDPDPNNIDYIRIVELGPNGAGYHAPANIEWTKNNSYDWIITGVGKGAAHASSTVLWSTEQTGGFGKRNLKAMINLDVNVVPDSTGTSTDDDKDKDKNKK